MSDNRASVIALKEKLIGQRIYEVITNFNAVPYLSLKIGDHLDVVTESEYRDSIREHRRCQPLRRYSVTIYCPHAIVSGDTVLWSTDVDYDLVNWAFYRGAPIFNMDVVPFLMGAYIVDVEQTDCTLSLKLDTDVTLLTYPVRQRPSDSVIEEFYRDPNADDADDINLNEFSLFDNVERTIVTFYNNSVKTEVFGRSSNFVNPETGAPVIL